LLMYYSHRQAVTRAQTVVTETSKKKRKEEWWKNTNRRSYKEKEENCLSLQKNHVNKKEDEKRKEKRNDKFKTLSFASIYPHERKSQVCIVGMHGFARSFFFLYLSLKVVVVIIGRIKKKVNKLISFFFLFVFILFEINTRIYTFFSY